MRKLLLVLLAAMTIVACKRDIEKANWNVDMAGPLVKSSLSIENILTSDLVATEADSSIKVVYSQQLYTATVDSIFKFRDTTLTYGTSLESLVLAQDSVVHELTMADIAASDPLFGPLIMSNHGNFFPFPAFSNINSGAINVDGGAFFQSMDVITGWLDIRIENGLPVDITNLDFTLDNAPIFGGANVANGNFGLIPSNTSTLQSYPLNGKTVYSQMIANMTNMSTAASSGPVLIDTTDAVIATISIRDLKPSNAVAKFPDQEVFKKIEAIKLVIGSNGQMMMREIVAKEGDIIVEVVNGIEDTIHFSYEIPSASKSGLTFKIDTFVPPAPNGGTTVMNVVYDFAGYALNLTGFGIEDDLARDINGNLVYDPDTINTFVQSLVGNIKGSDEFVSLALGDTFYVNAGLINLIPEKGWGYLGKDTIKAGPDKSKIDVFSKYISGALDLEDVNVNLTIQNGFGAEAEIDIVALASLNSNTSDFKVLASPAIASPITVPSAIEMPSAYGSTTPSFTTIGLNTSNSNIDELIEIFPTEFQYAININLNPNIPVPSVLDVTTNSPNFAYLDAGLEATIDIEAPLSMIANDLILADTIDFDLSDKKDENKVKNGTFNLIVENGFPLSAAVSIYMLDDVGLKIDSLTSNSLIASGNVELVGPEYKVTSKERSIITFDVPEDKMSKLFSTKNLLVIAKFNTTQPGGSFAKIYSDYTLDFKLTGDFKYHVTAK